MVSNGRLQHHHFGTPLPCGFTAATSERGSPFHSLGIPMKPTIPTYSNTIFRITLSVQLFVAAWFSFAPNLLPASFVAVEMQNDRPLYETLDNIIVPLVYVQTFLCIALWWPTRVASWAYLFVTSAIAVLGSFAGPSMLSAIDGTLGYLQVVASGAMLCVLYLGGFFTASRSGSATNA